MIELIINNKKLSINKNLTVLQACEQANISIPRFCYHEQLSIAGNCRMCLVEIEKSPKPVASCAMPVMPGMVIFTDTPLVKKAREAILEFLLLNHPLDCPICDQGGECDLQDLTLNFGSDRTRFFEFKHGVEDKECGPIVKTIMTRCIHCTRCIRFLTEIAGLEFFGALGRGESMEIGPFFSKFLKTELSGNLVDLCPVGALTSKPYAFLARNWELKKIETVDFLDSFGSNIIIHTRNNTESKKLMYNKFLIKDQILRVLPKFQKNLNEHWLSDKTRYALDGLFFNRTSNTSYKYSTNSFVKKNVPNSWKKNFLIYFYFSFYGHYKYQDKRIVGNLGKILSIEEIYFFFRFLKEFGLQNILIENNLYNFNIDLPIFYQFNSYFKEIERCDLLFLIYTNPRFDSSMLNIKIRKQYFNKEISIFYLGTFQEFTYPIVHLGQSLKVLCKILEGKHFFSKKIRSAKLPLVIIGSEIGYHTDGKIIQNLLVFLAKKSYLFLNTFIGLNFLHQFISQSNFCDLGITLNSFNKLYQMNTQKNLLKNYKFFNHNIDNNLISNENIFCSLQSFNRNEEISDKKITISKPHTIIVPINTPYERNALTSNSEGFIQKSFKVITPSFNNRNSEDFLKALLIIKNTPFLKEQLTLKTLIFINPFLLKSSHLRKRFKMNLTLNNYSLNKINFILQNNQINLKQYFILDPISKNSKIMSECNLFLTSSLNFIF